MIPEFGLRNTEYRNATDFTPSHRSAPLWKVLMPAETLYIVDVSSLVFQVFHAIRQPMTSPSGLPTNAAYGFLGDLMRLVRDIHPTHLVCALDSSGPGTRNEIYEDYKANRSETPPDLVPQFEMIFRLIEAFGIPAIECPGWEADDVIATLVHRASENGFEVRIVTSDKDIRQLLSPKVQIYNIRKDEFFDESRLQEEWGVRPDQVVDFQSLVGDSVDNVPGVPLVGPKKAQALLETYGTLDEVLSHAGEVKGKKLSENLKTYADQARMSKQLVALNRELDLNVDWNDIALSAPNVDQLVQLCKEFGFRRYADDVRKLGEAATVAGEAKPKQGSLFAPEERTWDVVDSSERWKSFLKELRQQKHFCVDLETTSLDAVRADIVGWAFCWEPKHAYYLPIQGPEGQATLDHDEVLQELKQFLEDPSIEVSNQNIKYDMLVLRRAGVTVEGVSMDPMIGDYLLDAGARGHGLDALAERYLDHKMIPISDLIGKGKDQKSMTEVDVRLAAEYASEDADITFRLAERIRDALLDEGLWDLYWDLERPLVPVLTDMEFTGIRVDVEELARQSAEVGERLETIIAEIYELAGSEFNIESPKQLRTILFEELELPIIKRTKTGPSTDQSVLEKLAALHPLPRKITEHRHLSKLKGTYLDALPNMVNPETGRIHASFNQVVAATGRLSSSDPNLQNIPIRTEEGRRIRRAFIPDEDGWKFVCADYSQIELRLLAHFSADAVLSAAFEAGEDIHRAVAAEIFGVERDAVDSEMRRVAKAVNFGVIYGQSPFGLAEALGISQDEAAEFIDGYFHRHSGVTRFLNGLLDECRKTGYARTILGRRRRIEGIRPQRGIQRNLSERTAINTVIQGSAADLIKRAMINLAARLKRDDSSGRMLLQIHDELVFEVPSSDVAGLVKTVREEMENAMSLKVPLIVDVSVGENWLDVEDFE